MSFNNWSDILLLSAVQFLDSLSLKLVFCISKQFSISRRSDSVLVQRLKSRACSVSYTYMIDKNTFYDHPICDRLTSFNGTSLLTDISTYQPTWRLLTQAETEFFSSFASPNNPVEVVQSFPSALLPISTDNFLQQMNDVFGFNHWAPDMDFNSYVLAGGAVSACLTRTARRTQDLDFFSTRSSLAQESRQEFILVERLTNLYGYTLYKSHVYRSGVCSLSCINSIICGGLKFQFIYFARDMTPIEILQSFDMDICEVLFNGFELKATSPFMHALQTRTFFCRKSMDYDGYPEEVSDLLPGTEEIQLNFGARNDTKVNEERKVQGRSQSRIEKYMSRGYSYLGTLE